MISNTLHGPNQQEPMLAKHIWTTYSLETYRWKVFKSEAVLDSRTIKHLFQPLDSKAPSANASFQKSTVKSYRTMYGNT